MIFIISFSTLLIALYGLMISSFWEGWSRRARHLPKKAKLAQNEYVSVLIPFRNEEENLGDLLSSLKAQSYASSDFEIIFIDDHSSDGGVEIIEAHDANSDLNIKCIPSSKQGKKAALTEGLTIAKGSIILQTDADCLPSPSWIQEMVEAFDEDTYIVLGLVKMVARDGFWSKFSALEFMSLQASGAALIMRSNPIMGSAASMAYRREMVSDKDSLDMTRASGDDVFLIQKALSKDKKVRYNPNPSSMVSTWAPSSLRAMVDQRSRWGAKTPSYTSKRAKYMALLVTSYSLWCLVLLVLGFFSAPLLQLFIFMIGAKAVLDYFFLKSFGQFTHQQSLMKVFPSAALVYPFYILFTLVRMLLPISWRGRIIR